MIDDHSQEKFYGDQTRWFTGSVVNEIDPMEVGRVQVRCYGVHSETIDDKDLPWAQVVIPATEGTTKGLGNQLGLKVGAMVYGIFLDGRHSQLPLVIGALPKLEGEDTSVNKLARGVQTKEYEPDRTIGEPADPYGSQYPYNFVYEMSSSSSDSDSASHIKEYDTTPGKERIRERHTSGTFYQMNPDGSMVTHVVKDNYSVIAGNDAIHVTGNVRVFIDQNSITTIQANKIENISGNAIMNVKSGALYIDTPSTVMTGDVSIKGSLSVGQTVTAGSDVRTGGGVSLGTHTHPSPHGVTASPNGIGGFALDFGNEWIAQTLGVSSELLGDLGLTLTPANLEKLGVDTRALNTVNAIIDGAGNADLSLGDLATLNVSFDQLVDLGTAAVSGATGIDLQSLSDIGLTVEELATAVTDVNIIDTVSNLLQVGTQIDSSTFTLDELNPPI